jgi:hypothetical protein
MGKWTEQSFQRKKSKWLKKTPHDKMLTIPDHKRNINQNHINIPS